MWMGQQVLPQWIMNSIELLQGWWKRAYLQRKTSASMSVFLLFIELYVLKHSSIEPEYDNQESMLNEFVVIQWSTKIYMNERDNERLYNWLTGAPM